nr:sigma-54-dependent Fis family transcriptional regulator [Flavobacterium sp.]
AEFLLQQTAGKYGNPEIRFETTQLALLEQYPWNGNIREMENKIERAVILAEGDTISVSDMNISAADLHSSEENPLSDIEKSAIENALRRVDGNISKAADELGLSRAALYRRMEKYNISK